MPVEADRGGVIAESAIAGLVDGTSHVPDEFGGLEFAVLGEHRNQPAVSELTFPAPVSLGYPVGEQQQPVTGAELHRVKLVAHRVHQPQGQSRRNEELANPAVTHQQRRRVPGVQDRRGAVVDVEFENEPGDEVGTRELLHQVPICRTGPTRSTWEGDNRSPSRLEYPRYRSRSTSPRE
jgi:hypothetical protein